ncbi:MAG: magnesium transporter [Methanotrichaceae archaeon]
MTKVDVVEEMSLLLCARTDQTLLVATPSKVSDSISSSFGNASKIVKQSFFALFICAVAGLFAGFFIARTSYLLAVYPGLIILIPGIIDMRGNIFGSFGARLGTSFHTGEISSPLSASEALRQQICGVAVQTLAMSLILALVVKGLGLATGLETLSTYDLILISFLSGTLSGGVLLFFTLLMIIQSFKKGWDPDNISVPLITATSDLITIPILFASAIIVSEVSELSATVTRSIVLMLIMFSTAATVYSFGPNYPILTKIVRQSLPVLTISALLSTVAGVFMGMKIDMLVAFSAVLLLIPVFNAEGGNLGGILSSQLTSAYHLGLIKMGRKPDRLTKTNFSGILLLSALIFPTLGFLTYVVSRIFGMTSLGFCQILLVCSVAGLFTAVLSIFITYHFTHFFVKIGIDPDNVTIPMITSVMDVLGTASLILVTMAVT